jgi:hypothetical protein
MAGKIEKATKKITQKLLGKGINREDEGKRMCKNR